MIFYIFKDHVFYDIFFDDREKKGKKSSKREIKLWCIFSVKLRAHKHVYIIYEIIMGRLKQIISPFFLIQLHLSLACLTIHGHGRPTHTGSICYHFIRTLFLFTE